MSPSPSFWTNRWSPWVLYAFTIASGLPLAALLMATNQPAPGECSGLLFGCGLYGWDLVLFAIFFLGIPYAIALAVVVALVCLLPERLQAVRIGVAAVGLVLPWVAVAFVPVVV